MGTDLGTDIERTLLAPANIRHLGVPHSHDLVTF